MEHDKEYFFASDRLGFRDWRDEDIEKMAAINSDKEAMKFFPSLQSLKETKEMIVRFQQEIKTKGHSYFAVDNFEDGEFVGFIGLHIQTFESDFTPCLDIGWRLDKKYWNKGYATEGAKRCLDFAFRVLKLEKIVAMAPKINLPSTNVMKKIGMTKILDFQHPLLLQNPRLIDCELYGITNSDYASINLNKTGSCLTK